MIQPNATKQSAAVGVTFDTMNLSVHRAFDNKGMPLCKCDAAGFKCFAIRAKTFALGEESGRLVHYCGVAPWDSKSKASPLRERGDTVRPNKTCPLHQVT